MYFWNYRQLNRDLKNNIVSDKQYHIYLAIFWPTILLGLWANIQDVASSSFNLMTYHHVLVLLYYPLWLGITYRINTLGDGKDYFKRLVCNKLPATIIMMVFTIFMVFLKYQITSLSTPDWSLLKQVQVMAYSNNYDWQWLICLGTLILYADAFFIASGLRKKH